MFSRCFLRLKGNLSIPRFSKALSNASSHLTQEVTAVNKHAAVIGAQVGHHGTFQFRAFCTAEKIPSRDESAAEKSSSTIEDTSVDSGSADNPNQDISFKVETLFLRGLPYYCTEKDIIEFFKTVNVVPKSVMIKHDRLGKTNGKAEVLFENEEDARKALKKHNAFIGNRYIEVSAEPFVAMNADRMFARNRMDFGSRPMHDQRIQSPSSPNWVRLSGLPYNATVEDIYKFFEPLDITPAFVDLKYANGVPTGFCNVKFETQEEATRSLMNNNAYIGNRYIRINLASDSQVPSQGGRLFSGRNRNFENERAFQHVEDDDMSFSTHKT